MLTLGSMLTRACALCACVATQSTAAQAPSSTATAPPRTTQEASDRPATAPTPPASGVNVIQLAQSAVLDSVQPTVSPTFGSVTAWAGPRLIVTGPERVKVAGFNGQIATFSESEGAWASNAEMAGIQDTNQGETILQSVVGNDDWLFTSSELSGRAGSVVVWKREPTGSGWTQVQRLTPPASRNELAFGSSLALGNGFLAVSAVDNRFRGEQGRAIVDAPRVYLFQLTNGVWNGAGSLSLDPERRAIWFGGAIAAHGDQLVVSSPRGWQPSPKQPVQEGGECAVHIYRRGADGVWALRQTIAPPSDCAWTGFGSRVALVNDLLVIRATDVPTTAARLFVYQDVGTWTQTGELTTTWAKQGSGFGTSFDIGDGFIVAGDTTAERGGERIGAITVFVPSAMGWVERYGLVPSVPVAARRYGIGISARGKSVAAGRMTSEADNIVTGGAVVFTVP